MGIHKSRNLRRPSIFLSHKQEDKALAEKIGKYFFEVGIDVYLDKYDKELKENKDNAKKVVECIHRGIEESSYVLCIVSEHTEQSWWVPYEIGYGVKANKEIITLLKRKNVVLPEFLEVGHLIRDMKELQEWANKISRE